MTCPFIPGNLYPCQWGKGSVIFSSFISDKKTLRISTLVGRLAFCFCLSLLMIPQNGAAQNSVTYPFQNPKLDIEQRVTNLLSLMSREEKIRAMSTVPDIPRLGVLGTGHVEGLHGLAMGQVGNWGGGGPGPTTQFPQAIGMGETWDPELIRNAGQA